MSKYFAVREIANEDWKTQVTRGYPNIPKGAEVEVIEKNFVNFYGSFMIVYWNNNIYYTKKENVKEVEDNEGSN